VKLGPAVERACQRVPGVVCGALVLLPEGLLLAGVGGETALDLEPLIRSASRCLASRPAPGLTAQPPEPFVEYLFVIHDQLVVVQRGRREARLALALACTREHNVGFALTAARLAMADVEAEIDLAAWGL
jgi:hypothetical protein